MRTIKFGWYVLCHYSDDAPEPEGEIVMDVLPFVGMGLRLIDGNIYRIIAVDNYQLHIDAQLVEPGEAVPTDVFESYDENKKLRLL